MDLSQLNQLAEARQRFLRFVATYVADPDMAEDIVQASLTKAVAGFAQLRERERAIPWFYTILRNEITSAYRDRARSRASVLPPNLDLEEEPATRDPELCRCFEPLLPALPPQYAEMIERLDLQSESASTVARSLGITPGNLKVRHHRARQALRRALEDTCRVCATHHCVDCTCRLQG